MTSSTQHLMFVGSYVASDQPGLQAFLFDETTGLLTAHGSFAGITNPAFIVVHPNKQWLYTVSETDQGSVWALRFEREPWAIQALNHQPSGGDAPCHLQLDATGKWLFVANYMTGSTRVLPILADGALGEMTDHLQHQGSGPNLQRQEGPHAHSVTMTPDNRFAIIADLGLDQLIVYKFDATHGKLDPHGQMQTHPGAGPRHLAFHPNGRIVYAANELDNTVSVCAYDAVNGALSETQTLDTLPPEAPENTVADIHLSSSAQRLYVSNRGHNSLAVFAVGVDGQLARLVVAPCGGDWPRNFALAPGGRFMLVANQYSGEVCALPVLADALELGPSLVRVAVKQPSCVQFVAG